MAQGRRNEEWYFWASLESLIANVHRDRRKTSEYKIEHFHPYLARSKPRKTMGEFFAVAKAHFKPEGAAPAA